MKKLVALSLLSLVLSASSIFAQTTSQNDPDKKEWIQLFNGKDLKGWDIKLSGHELNDNYRDTVRVDNGVIKVSYDKYDQFNNRFGHIFYNQPFSHYILAAEYRFLGEQAPGGPDWGFRNSGLMLHCQSAKSMLKAQDFPISIEVQLLGGRETGERSTANLCTPGTNVVMDGKLVTQHCVNSKSKTYRGDQWVRVEVMVLGGGEVKHMIEGQPVIEYSQPQMGGGNVSNFDTSLKQDGKILTEGYISFQAESHPVEFRKIELVNLVGCRDPKATNYKSYHVTGDNSLCKYAK